MTPEQAVEWYLQRFYADPSANEDAYKADFGALNYIIHTQRSEAVAEAMAWRPIETAPKDGTKILLFRPQAQELGESSIKIGYWMPQCNCFSAENLKYNPATHWMPLPPAPQEGQNQC